ncbi:MAG: hypothetical protein QOE23_409 [Pseudonocardiales bacterium]|nr:hypothetical protein [Pseudonocardiales bacterium]
MDPRDPRRSRAETPTDEPADLERRVALIEDQLASSCAEIPDDELIDTLRNAAAFQRDLFRIEDGRLAGTDSQAAILIAAAVAIVTFTGGLVKAGHVRTSGLIATAILAILVAIVALYARRERPKAIGGAAREMRSTGERAAQAVEAMYNLVNDLTLTNSKSVARAEYDSWYALSKSLIARRRVKTYLYFVAVVLLLVEVGAAMYTAHGLRT